MIIKRTAATTTIAIILFLVACAQQFTVVGVRLSLAAQATESSPSPQPSITPPATLSVQQGFLPNASEQAGTRDNPVPITNWKTITQDHKVVQIAFTQVLRGLDGLPLILQANSFNKPPRLNMEYAAVYVQVKYVNGPTGSSISVSPNDFAVFGQGEFLDDTPDFSLFAPAPELNYTLYPGDSAGGWIARSVRYSDNNPLLVVDPFSIRRTLSVAGTYFSITP
ncbi:MAG: hypothetical protein ABI947_25505 [Chloroflexota bacterium]